MNQKEEKDDQEFLNEEQRVNSSEKMNEIQVDDKKSFVREYLGLLAILLIALGNQWQRYILAYANAVDDKRYGSKFAISREYGEQWKQTYGLLSGLFFTGTFAVFGVFGGAVSDTTNRKTIIIVTSIGWSACTLLSGIVESFHFFVVMRILLGFFQAFLNPAAYSILSDYFPPSMRTRATSVLNLAIYFGGAMSSLSQIMILNKGWRYTYQFIGMYGIVSSLIGICAVYNPVRGKWENPSLPDNEEPKERQSVLRKFCGAMGELFKNPTSRWVSLGGFMRFFGGYAIGFFLPKYFNLVYPKFSQEFAIGNAFVVSLFGLLSAISGGWVSDKYENKGYLMTKPYVCIISGFTGSIFFALVTLIQSSFWFSLTMLALEYLAAENWIAPAITMIMNTAAPDQKGVIVSALLFWATIGGTISNATINLMFNYYDVNNHPERSGYILCGFVLFSYLGSIPFFYLAGLSYKKHKENQIKELELS